MSLADADPIAMPPVSVVLLSHRRPHLLSRVVHGVAQLDYPNFEVVVVGDQPTIHDYGLPTAWAQRIRYAQVAEQNVCKSRNIGIKMSGGDIIAFCDDDAVPEPDWLSELVIPFRSASVGVVAGAVRGANGLHMEWTGGWFDRTGRETPMERISSVKIVDSKSQVAASRFLALMGVNTAFRREALFNVGGFDHAYQYYLDETDLALRLARAGWAAAYVPSAEVHHLRQANVARDAWRTPRNLFQIAASKAYFCQRHLPPAEVASALAGFRKRRIAELDPYIRLGVLRRTGRDALIQQMDDGLADGVERRPGLPLDPSAPRPAFRPFLPEDALRPLSVALISGWGLGHILRVRDAARQMAESGFSVTCISYASGPQPLSVNFDRGVWLHKGGTWQITDLLRRSGLILRHARAKAELTRIADRRRVDLALHFGRQRAKNQTKIATHPVYGAIWAQAIGISPQDMAAVGHEIVAALSQKTDKDTGNPEAEVTTPGRLELSAQPYMGYTRPRVGLGR